MMKEVAGVEDATTIGVMAVEKEEPVLDKVDEVQVAVVHVTTTEILVTFRRIVGNRVEEHVIRKKKTLGRMLVNQIPSESLILELYVILHEVLNQENET